MEAANIDLLHLEPLTVSVQDLYLDPNNPRLAGGIGEDRVPDSAIMDSEVQNSLLKQLRDVGLGDIIDKLRKLGFVPIDRVVVRPIPGQSGKYVVLEGNRRLAAIRALKENGTLLGTVPEGPRASLDQIDVLAYHGSDDDIAWLIQGFRHIQSIKDWGPYQQGRYLVDLSERRSFNAKEVATLAGIARSKVSRLVRSYYAWNQARGDDDYGDLVGEDDFAIFNEAVFAKSQSPLWLWLEWDDEDREFKNRERLGLLLSLVKNREGEAPRIARVNPDLRDRFARLTVKGNEEQLERFLGGADLDVAYQAIEREETEKQTRDTLVDVEAQQKQLTLMVERLLTLPLPKIISSGLADDFEARLREISEVAQKQRQLLTSSGGEAVGD